MKVYTKTGLWLKEIESSHIKIGISAYGQDDVGEITFFDPMEDEELTAGEAFAAVEGSKAVTEVPAPVSGKIIEWHEALLQEPWLLNETDDTKNWFVTVEVEKFNPSNFLKEDLPIPE